MVEVRKIGTYTTIIVKVLLECEKDFNKKKTSQSNLL